MAVHLRWVQFNMFSFRVCLHYCRRNVAREAVGSGVQTGILRPFQLLLVLPQTTELTEIAFHCTKHKCMAFDQPLMLL